MRRENKLKKLRSCKNQKFLSCKSLKNLRISDIIYIESEREKDINSLRGESPQQK